MNYRSSSTTVCQATPADVDVVRCVLVEAFQRGDLAGWLIPHLDTRRRVYSQYFEVLAEHALKHAQVESTEGGQAVAIWYAIADGELPVIARHDERLTTIITGSEPRFAALDQALQYVHPREPRHQYLALLAVHPRHQGHGLGSALLHHRHAALDAADTPAFLVATGTRNRHLFTRHGYLPRPVCRIRPDGPQLYPLWRPAAPPPERAGT